MEDGNVYFYEVFIESSKSWDIWAVGTLEECKRNADIPFDDGKEKAWRIVMFVDGSENY